jgi:hypothetical protein
LLAKSGMTHAKAMKNVPFNTGNHWITLAISTKYDQVWYYDSSRSIDLITDK